MGSKKDGFGVQSGRGGYHRKSCKTILFESITHYNFNPYVKKSDLQSLCKTVVWNLLLQNAPPLLLPTIEPCPKTLSLIFISRYLAYVCVFVVLLQACENFCINPN